jgi:hypothetical protein
LTGWLLTIWSILLPSQPPLATMTAQGSFREGGYYCQQMRWSRPQRGEIAYDSGAGPNTGELRSSRFVLPAEIHFYSAGFLSHPGLRIYLRNVATGKQLDLRQRIDPAMTWKPHYFQIPDEWRGQTVEFVAEDKATGSEDWMGVTAPKAGGEPLLYSLFRAANRTGMQIILVGLFLLPGLALALLAARRVDYDFGRLTAAILCGSGAAGYAAFWIYFASARAGKISVVVLAFASVASIVWKRNVLFHKPSPGMDAALRETFACLGLTLTVAVFYTALGFLYVTDDFEVEQAQVRYNEGFLPPDNVLPEMLAERLYKGAPMKPNLFSIWHGSDRPPLQAGTALLVFPFLPVSNELAYQLLSVFLQCLWLPGLWILARAAGLGNRYLVPIMGFAIFSELCLVHSFYVWPKLLAAAYMLMAMATVFRREWTPVDAVLSASSLSLALLSHTGVAFTVLPLGIFVIVKGKLPRGKLLAAGLAIGLAFLLPWRWYQTVYDPPGDTLLKFNMTFAQDEANLQRPLFDLLKESYARMTPASYLKSKEADIEAIYTGGEMAALETGDWRKALTALETGSFFRMLVSLGLLNAGFVCCVFARRGAAVKFADSCLWIVGGSAVLWLLILYPPGATVIHQWSMASMLLLFAALTIYLAEARPRLVYPLLALQIFGVFPLLIFAKPFIQESPGVLFDAPLDAGMAAVAAMTFAAILGAGWRAKLQEVS